MNSGQDWCLAMTFTVHDYHEVVRLLREHPELRVELRHLLLPDDLLDLPAVMRELAMAQQRTEEQLAQLTARVDSLAAAQQRTEERLEQLAAAQQRTEERLEQLVAAQQRTEEQLEQLGRRTRTDRRSAALGRVAARGGRAPGRGVV